MSVKPIKVAPAKRFFVEMLTRDIDLDDAIMDLVDNSVDGLLRVTKGDKSLYGNYKIRIEIKDNEFKILDNCGGISRDIAEKYAFRMGRPYGDERDDDIPTIGMYGIGMKRALFKMGTDILVTSAHSDECFKVHIGTKWLHDDSDWELNMEDCTDSLDDWNTVITVNHLHSGIKTLFSEDHDFVSKLIDKIGIHYTAMIKYGLSIELVHEENPKIEVEAKEISFLVEDENNAFASKKGILPYVYREENDGLKVTLICGIVGLPPQEDEMDERGSRIEAGWSIACNDRIVVYADTSRLTGWGDGLPKFHYQFNHLVGIVLFESNDADKLPVTTTKRGIDASSDIFLRIRRRMIEAMKHFTQYTNKWKNDRGVEKEEVLSQTKALSLDQLVLKIEDIEYSTTREGKAFVPSLPKPKPEVQKTKSMRFTKDKQNIETIAKCFFEMEEYTLKDANQVAEMCFDEILAKVKEGC